MAKQPDVQTAESQTKINAAPTTETSATDTREVETRNAPLVFNNGTPVVVDDAGDDTSHTLYSPFGGTKVTVVGGARRDTLLARGYTTSAPSGSDSTASA